MHNAIHNAFHSELTVTAIDRDLQHLQQHCHWYDCDKHTLLTLCAAEITHTLFIIKTSTLKITNVNTVMIADAYGEPTFKYIHKNAYFI